MRSPHGKVALFTGCNKPLTIAEYPVVAPAAEQALLKLTCSGICGTDVHIHEGFLGMPDMPLVIGHEFSGTVEQLGSTPMRDGLGTPLAAGDPVIACVAVPCGQCFNCKRGETASCLAFGVTYVKNAGEAPHFHGGLGEYLYSPAANLVRVPDGVDPLAAAAFPCGGPTIIRAFAYGGGIEAGELVVVQGNGALGLFALAWAKRQGATVVVIGSEGNAARMALMRALKPDGFLNYRTTSPEAARKTVADLAARLGRGDGADVVVETSGNPKAFPEGLALVRTRGRYLVPGQYSNRGPVSIEPQLVTFKALQIIGAAQYQLADIGTYLDFLKTHADLQPLFRSAIKCYPIEAVNEALADAARGAAIKAAICSRTDK
jgi:threonine dehydrogenase-like Zn-dependent dehydrogenase